MKKRPSWGKGFRREMLEAQNYKCAYCGEALEKKGSELHHDYKGHNWAVIRDIAQSDDLAALGFEGKALKILLNNLYHDRGSLYAMHPKCHVQADTAQREGLIEQVKRARA